MVKPHPPPAATDELETPGPLVPSFASVALSPMGTNAALIWAIVRHVKFTGTPVGKVPIRTMLPIGRGLPNAVETKREPPARVLVAMLTSAASAGGSTAKNATRQNVSLAV